MGRFYTYRPERKDGVISFENKLMGKGRAFDESIFRAVNSAQNALGELKKVRCKSGVVVPKAEMEIREYLLAGKLYAQRDLETGNYSSEK
jgi:hypothetical protein